jgi:outer membrane protein OmpA-like peptidoglycan-associated protein
MITKKTFIITVLVIFLAIQATATLAFVDLSIGPTGLSFYDNNQELLHFGAAVILLLGFTWLGIRHVIDKESLRNSATTISVSLSFAIAFWLFPIAFYIRNKVFIDFLLAATFFIAFCWLGLRTFYGEHHETNAVKAIAVVVGLLLAVAFSTLQFTAFFSDNFIKTLLVVGGALLGALFLASLFGIKSWWGRLLLLLGLLLALFLAVGAWNYFTFDNSDLGLGFDGIDVPDFGGGSFPDFDLPQSSRWDREGAIPTRFNPDVGFMDNIGGFFRGLGSGIPSPGNWWNQLKDGVSDVWKKVPGVGGDSESSGTTEEEKKKEAEEAAAKEWKGGCRLDGNFNKDKTTFVTSGNIGDYVKKAKAKGAKTVYVYGFASMEYAGTGDGVKYNKQLSSRRAKTVAGLIKKAGLKAELSAQGQTDDFQKGEAEKFYPPNRRYVITTEKISSFTPAPPLGKIVGCDTDAEKDKKKKEEEGKKKKDANEASDIPSDVIETVLKVVNADKKLKLTESMVRTCFKESGRSITYNSKTEKYTVKGFGVSLDGEELDGSVLGAKFLFQKEVIYDLCKRYIPDVNRPVPECPKGEKIVCVKGTDSGEDGKLDDKNRCYSDAQIAERSDIIRHVGKCEDELICKKTETKVCNLGNIHACATKEQIKDAQCEGKCPCPKGEEVIHGEEVEKKKTELKKLKPEEQVKKFTKLEDHDFVGTTDTLISGDATVEKCAQKCVDTTNCKGFWFNDNTKNCGGLITDSSTVNIKLETTNDIFSIYTLEGVSTKVVKAEEEKKEEATTGGASIAGYELKKEKTMAVNDLSDTRYDTLSACAEACNQNDDCGGLASRSNPFSCNIANKKQFEISDSSKSWDIHIRKNIPADSAPTNTKAPALEGYDVKENFGGIPLGYTWKGESLTTCKANCDQNKKCKLIVFKPIGGECFLYNFDISLGVRKQMGKKQPGVHTYYKEGTTLEVDSTTLHKFDSLADITIDGRTRTVAGEGSPSACSQKCLEDDTCWGFEIRDDKCVMPLGGKKKTKESTGSTLWVKKSQKIVQELDGYTMSIDTDIRGEVIEKGNTNLAVCKNTCDESKKCTSIVWVESQGRCYAKEGNERIGKAGVNLYTKKQEESNSFVKSFSDYFSKLDSGDKFTTILGGIIIVIFLLFLARKGVKGAVKKWGGKRDKNLAGGLERLFEQVEKMTGKQKYGMSGRTGEQFVEDMKIYENWASGKVAQEGFHGKPGDEK